MNRQSLLRTCLCFVSIAMALGQFQSLNAEDKSPEKQNPPRDPSTISREQTALVRLASKKIDEAQRVKAIVDLCKLSVEIGEHPDVEKNPTLQRVSVELQTRLRGIQDRLASELRRRNVPEPESMIEAERAKRKTRAANRTLATASAFESSAGSDVRGSNSSDSESVTNSESVDSSSSLTGLGGPGGVDEMGWWLVDLIRHTVEPDYWDTAGGPGTVVYYGPSRALVVRGSWRVHEAVADMLSALR